MAASLRFLAELTTMIAMAHRMNAVRKLCDPLATDMENSGGMKKKVTTSEERMTATKPATMPPNQALPMTAPKNRNTNGYAMTCWSGNVQSSATSTKQTAIAPGLTPYCMVQRESRDVSAPAILES